MHLFFSIYYNFRIAVENAKILLKSNSKVYTTRNRFQSMNFVLMDKSYCFFDFLMNIQIGQGRAYFLRHKILSISITFDGGVFMSLHAGNRLITRT